MSSSPQNTIAAALTENEAGLLEEWLAELQAGLSRTALSRATTLRQDCTEFLHLLAAGARRAPLDDAGHAGWQEVRDFLGRLSKLRNQQGFTPSETAVFVLSFKKPLLRRIHERTGGSAEALYAAVAAASGLFDGLALFTMEVFQKGREEVIARQQHDMLELSTPVVKLWEGVLALPLIGTLDSERTQVVMETLLQRIVETGSEVAIIDITGVPTVDTLVAQHLLKTVAAARLMGVECIISGIRPQIAQTIVHLGVNLGDVTTKAGLAEAFHLALRQRGLVVARAPKA